MNWHLYMYDNDHSVSHKSKNDYYPSNQQSRILNMISNHFLKYSRSHHEQYYEITFYSES